MPRKPIIKIREEILDRAGVTPTPHSRHMVSAGAHKDSFHKTDKMKMLEYRFNIRIEHEIFKGSLNELVKRFNYEVERSTLSKWRTRLQEVQDVHIHEQD